MNKNQSTLKKGRGFAGQKMIVLPQKIVANLTKNPLLKTLFLTHIGYFPKAEYHYREREKGTNEYILIYCVDGKGWYEIDENKFDVEPNVLFILPAGFPHRYSADSQNPWSIYWLHFAGNIANKFTNSFEGSGRAVHRFIHNKDRIQIFEEIYQTLERGYSTDNLGYANTCLWHFLGSFLFSNTYDRIKSGKEEKDLIEVSISFMKNNLRRSLSLEELAQHVHYSVSHFSFLFKKQTGYSPVDYLIHLKIQKACQYLDLTSLNINEIAQKLGYHDNHYFSRLFHKIMGLSPTEYRKKQKG